jgi:hypothetical protein
VSVEIIQRILDDHEIKLVWDLATEEVDAVCPSCGYFATEEVLDTHAAELIREYFQDTLESKTTTQEDT